MSAFLVSPAHINFIVNFSRKAFARDIGTYYRDTFENPKKLGATLFEANVRSTDYRYPRDASEDSDAYTRDHYRWKASPDIPVTVENIAKLFKALDCLEYQSCEFPTWKESEAFKVIELIRGLATKNLPGYEAAPWAIAE